MQGDRGAGFEDLLLLFERLHRRLADPALDRRRADGREERAREPPLEAGAREVLGLGEEVHRARRRGDGDRD